MLPRPRLAFHALVVFFFAFLSGGCWDQVGIADRTLVIGIGIDLIQGDRPILLTAQVINFSAFRGGGARSGSGDTSGAAAGSTGSSAGASPVILETMTGKNLSDAIHNFLKHSSRQITFSHDRVVILGKGLARAGIAGVFDDMARNPQFRPTNWVLVAKGSAEEILSARTDLGVIPGLELNKMMSNLMRNALVLPVNLNDLLYLLNGEAKTGFVPMIQLEKAGANSSARIKIENTAIIKNGRLAGVLTVDESQGLLWLTDWRKGGLVVVASPAGGKMGDNSVEITDGAARIKPRIIDGRIRMEITCTGHGILRESGTLGSDPGKIRWLEVRTEKALKARVERTIAKARRLGVDFLGFARLIHADYPELWHRIAPRWEQRFAGIETSVHFQINLVHYGTIKNPAIR